MAINFNEIFETLHEIQTKIDRMVMVVQIAKEEKCSVEVIGDISFTLAQKAMLKNEYLILKSEVETLWQTLP